MTKLILVTGTAGAGKTSILTRLSELNGNSIRVLNMGTEMMDMTREKYNITDRDQLRRMDDKTVISIRNAIMQKISRIQGGHHNRHPRLGEAGKEVQAGLFHRRVQKDKDRDNLHRYFLRGGTCQEPDRSVARKRAYENSAEIDEWRSVNISIISTFAVYLNIPIYIIYNQEGKQDEAAAELDRITKEIIGG